MRHFSKPRFLAPWCLKDHFQGFCPQMRIDSEFWLLAKVAQTRGDRCMSETQRPSPQLPSL